MTLLKNSNEKMQKAQISFKNSKLSFFLKIILNFKKVHNLKKINHHEFHHLISRSKNPREFVFPPQFPHFPEYFLAMKLPR